MSAGVVNLQAQVESVLGALVKAATVELTKLFESRYRASLLDADAGLTDDKKQTGPLDVLSAGDTTRSIGVQVDDIYSPFELRGASLWSFKHGDFLFTSRARLQQGESKSRGQRNDIHDGGCLRECKVEADGGLIPSELLLPEEKGPVDPCWSPLKEQVVGTVDGVEQNEPPPDSHPQTEAALHVSAETLRHGSPQSSAAEQKPLLVQPVTCDVISGEKIKFVCPLILKPESPASKPDGSEKPVQPQQVCASTAKGTAYSPSLSDGAATPAQVGVWERIHTPKDAKNNLHMKLKLTPPDKKLTRPCAVQLVDVLRLPTSEMKLQDAVAKSQDATNKTGWPLPKDLRRHQGLHTGHRLCCFTPCENGIWRLQKVVSHSRDGYPCSICGKTFKRRKILRRHERFHSGERPYPCSMCTKTFALRKSLRRHLRFHTGQKPHACVQCGKSFRLRDNLKAHLRFHTGEKPFSCATCGKMFRIAKNLEKHKLSPCGFFVPSFRTIAGF